MPINIIVPKTKTERKKINSSHHSTSSLCRYSIVNLQPGEVVVSRGGSVIFHGMTQLPRYRSVLRLTPKGQTSPEVGAGRTLVLDGAAYPSPVPFVEHDLGELSFVLGGLFEPYELAACLGYLTLSIEFFENPAALRPAQSTLAGDVCHLYPTLHMFLKRRIHLPADVDELTSACLVMYQCATAEIMTDIKPFEFLLNVSELARLYILFGVQRRLLLANSVIEGKRVDVVHCVCAILCHEIHLLALVRESHKVAVPLAEVEYLVFLSLCQETFSPRIATSGETHNVTHGRIKEFGVPEAMANSHIESISLIVAVASYEVGKVPCFYVVRFFSHRQKISPNTTLEMALELAVMLCLAAKTCLFLTLQSSRNCDAKIWNYPYPTKFAHYDFNISKSVNQRNISAITLSKVYKYLNINKLLTNGSQIVVLNVVGSSPTGHPTINTSKIGLNVTRFGGILFIYVIDNKYIIYFYYKPP